VLDAVPSIIPTAKYPQPDMVARTWAWMLAAAPWFLITGRAVPSSKVEPEPGEDPVRKASPQGRGGEGDHGRAEQRLPQDETGHGDGEVGGEHTRRRMGEMDHRRDLQHPRHVGGHAADHQGRVREPPPGQRITAAG